MLAVQNETATGVTSDIGAVRKAMDAAGHPALLYVDGVSSIGSIDFRMDEWRVDLAVAGSQKGLMLPAGLGIVCASPRALAAYKTAQLKRVYFDFGDMIKANATGYFPYTPPLPMLYGLRESLKILFEEKLEHVFERHHRPGERRARRGQGLGPQALRQGTEMVFGYGDRDRRPAGLQRRRRHRRRLPPLQPVARRRPVPGRGKSVPHRPSRRPQRSHGAWRARRSGNGDGAMLASTSSSAAALAPRRHYFRSTIMAKEKKPTDQQHFAELHPEGVIND